MPKTETLEAEEVREKSHKKHIEEDGLLTVREVAKRLKVDDTTVRRWVKNKALSAVSLPHVGKRQAYRIKRSVLDSVLNGEMANSTEAS